jgi:hypothetical protein
MAHKRLKALFSLLLVSLFVVLAACAPRQAPAPDDTEAPGGIDLSEVELPTWTEESDCASCHTAETASASDSACAYSLHAPQPEVACGTCHSDEGEALAKAHERYATALQPVSLKRTKVTEGACTAAGCHSVEELAAATASSSTLTDANGTVVNPHGLPTTDRHATSVSCSSCHKQHKPEPASEVAPSVCISCHHEDVYECGTCHE